MLHNCVSVFLSVFINVSYKPLCACVCVCVCVCVYTCPFTHYIVGCYRLPGSPAYTTQLPELLEAAKGVVCEGRDE